MRDTVFFVVLAMTLAARASAQPSADMLPLSLEDAVARGLETSLRLAEAEARGDAARAVVEQREAGRRPQIAAQAGYMRTNHVDEFGVPLPGNELRVIYPDIPDNYRTRLDVLWPIYTGGRQAAVERAARTEADAVFAERDAMSEDVRLEITRAYWTLVTSIDAVAVMEGALARTTAHLTEARNQLDAGLAAPNDVLTVEAQEARQRMLAIRSAATRDSAEADLARLIGAPPGTRLSPTSPLAAGVSGPAASASSIEALAADAREQRADRMAIVERLEATRARRAAAAAGTRPTLALGGGFDYAQPNPRIFPRQEAWKTSWDASVNVIWPLSDGGRTRGEVTEAEALARAAQARLDEFDRVLIVEIGHRLRDIEAGRAAIEAAEAGVRAATEARRVAADRFAAGVATNTDVLTAQSALLQAELDRSEALAALRVAEARLSRVLGR